MDESGFEAETHRPHAWAPRGVVVHGKVTGNRKKGRTNLIMALRGKEWLAPLTFTGTCHHDFVTTWVKECLIPVLRPNSLLVMDNAPFHNQKNIAALLKEHGHTLLPLPTYSPDFNPIEQSFAIIKRIRQFSNHTLESILTRNSYLE